ncbi:gamma-glutamylcyclotransferase family protein [Ramlibacter albus]|uniref:Gamma-glutamylcyclotransferase family protein n=1 Tax=Ramlibacter albus TaxID=2079448 RepID=A0A923S141_9BURK|nr:gamma-glutamylcyclotransferase family protein [Ramlibacter albus]MBC5763895.1 gamma-glutamylcyclotransferase [Ramlibacter albus]
MAHLVFVFGTLKQGFPNFGFNTGRRVVGDFVTQERYPMYLVGERHVPWMIDTPGTGHEVVGQVFEVDATALAAMDALERVNEPDGYRRVLIGIRRRDAVSEVRQAFAYMKPAEQLDPMQVQVGPLAEYTMEHAALYRYRP